MVLPLKTKLEESNSNNSFSKTVSPSISSLKVSVSFGSTPESTSLNKSKGNDISNLDCSSKKNVMESINSSLFPIPVSIDSTPSNLMF